MDANSATEIYAKLVPSAARLRKQDLRMGGKSSEERRKAPTGAKLCSALSLSDQLAWARLKDYK